MIQPPLVSIIVPTFNSGSYLNRCLSSIEKQSYTTVEVVIVDAGSRDNTLDIINQYQSKLNIQYFVLEKSTQSEARNLGLQNTKGDYIAFCDSDDFYLPDKIKKQMETMNDHSIDVCYFDVLHFYSGLENDLFINQHPNNPDMLAECIANQTINLNSVLIRKKFLDKNNLFFPTGEMGRYGEDGNFIFHLALHQAKFKKLEDNLSVVEVRKDSHTQWEAQWKMKHYAIQYRINAKEKLNSHYQELIDQSIKSLRFKLIIALIIAGKHKEAKFEFKTFLHQDHLAWIADAVFFLLNLVPKKLTQWILTTLWNRRRIKNSHIYL